MWRYRVESHASTSGGTKRQSQQQLLDNVGEYRLTQVVNIPTRNDKTVDLPFTNFPSPVNRVKEMPAIGKADNEIVYVEYDNKAKRIKQAPRKVYLYKRADMVELNDYMTQFKDAYLSEIVSEYDQEIPQSQNADNPVAPRGRAAQQEDKLSKAISSLFPIKMIAILEWT